MFLKYWINFNLFLDDWISLTLFGNIGPLKLGLILNYVIPTGNWLTEIFAIIFKNGTAVIQERNCDFTKHAFKF